MRTAATVIFAVLATAGFAAADCAKCPTSIAVSSSQTVPLENGFDQGATRLCLSRVTGPRYNPNNSDGTLIDCVYANQDGSLVDGAFGVCPRTTSTDSDGQCDA
ncbi:hypothetical protein FIBSPDRAFT_902433 [Athelia psychrophila]|uniref:Cyanovirin-N domain-containing protein n=1 Tax=Athelia psychrophila TaxID=1759441 RepID=A0A167X7R3_9AGAM|nr:hypothetical protein FIBSPDRAFT_902433 [Fibularhizoctonia sp. CBS 109695]